MRKLLLLGSLITVLVPSASRAQVTLGLRVGWAPAMGDVVKDAKLSDAVKSQFPIQLDAMYRITTDFSAGVYGSYGWGLLGDQVKNACDAINRSCDASNVRVGAQLAYAFNQMKAPLVPWVGVGSGYEWNMVKTIIGDTTARGWEYVNLQLGGDYKVSPQFAIGPFINFSIGQYSKQEVPGSTLSISDKGTHEWFGFGLRGKFDL